MTAWEDDLLGRAEVAGFLQNLLESDDSIKVINIDSPWGTGKTFFLENWKAQLEQDRGVVYFNAWKKDYTGDPFVSLVSVIKDQLEKQVGDGKKENETVVKFKEKAQETFLATAPTALKYLGKGLLKKALGVDLDDLDQEVASILNDATDVALKSVIDDFKNSEKVIEDFEVTFTALVEAVAKKKSGDSKRPVYVLIDELDRCRPTYAIELLERVKHFFNVPGCKFVIATDTGQLIHSVKAIYGEGFDSNEYLKRFFDLGYNLDNSDVESWVVGTFKDNDVDGKDVYCLDLVSEMPTSYAFKQRIGADYIYPDNDTVINDGLSQKQAILIALAKTFNCSLRTFERVLRHLRASLANIKNPSVHYFFLAYLIFLKNKDSDMYNELLFGKEDARKRIRKVDEKYVPKKLYFKTHLLSVHEVAYDYIRFSEMGYKDVRNNKEEQFLYIEKIRDHLWDKNATFDYYKVVDLAGMVE